MQLTIFSIPYIKLCARTRFLHASGAVSYGT